MKKKYILIIFCALSLIAIIGYTKLGFYTIQPLGGLPEGKTVLILRNNEEPFFNSLDAVALREYGQLSILTRMYAAREIPNDRIIIKLPYWRFAYLRSTSGQEYER